MAQPLQHQDRVIVASSHNRDFGAGTIILLPDTTHTEERILVPLSARQIEDICANVDDDGLAYLCNDYHVKLTGQEIDA